MARSATACESRAASDLFVGRADELRWLSSRWDAACEGHPQSVLVRGEPGVGKTRLVRHFSARAAMDDGIALFACGTAESDAPPLWPWICVLRQLQQHKPAAWTCSDALVCAFAPWLPWLPPQPPQPQSQSQGQTLANTKPTQRVLVDALAQATLSVAALGPVCLVLEDLHEFDHGSLEVVREVLAQASGRRLMVLGTSRTAEALSAGEPLMSLLDGFEHTLELAGFDVDEVAELMQLHLRQPVSRKLAERVHARCYGNALYVRAVLSRLTASASVLSSSVDLLQLRLPESLRRAGSRQLDAASGACRRLLELGAILGREFELGVLSGMAHVSAAALEQTLAEACRLGVVSFDPLRPERYRFTHALLHEWLVADLAPATREQAHALAAEALLERGGPEVVRARRSAAHHLCEVGDEASLERAVALARSSGQEAAARGADAESAQAYALAVSATRRQLVAAGSDRSHELQNALGLRLIELAEARWRAGEHATALRAGAEAAALAQELGDAELSVRAALATLDNFNVLLTPVQQRLCDIAYDRLASVTPPLRVRFLALRANQRFAALDPRCVEDLARARRERELGSDVAADLALAFTELAACDPFAPLSARRALIEHHRALAHAAGDTQALAWSEAFLLHFAIEAVDPEGIVQHEARLAALVHELGDSLRWMHQGLCWMIAHMRGDLDEAFALLEKLAPSEHHAGSAVTMLHFCERLALVRHTGDSEAVLAAFRAVPELLREVSVVVAARAAVFAEQGDAAAARVELARARAGLLTIPTVCEMVQTLWSLDDATGMPEAYAALLPHAGRYAVLPLGTIGYGAVDFYLGLAASMLGHKHEAIAHFEAALRVNARLGALPSLARTHFELARALIAAGQDVCGRAHARESHELATGLHMSQLTAAAGSLLAEQPTAAPRAPQPAPNVFRREGELWTISFNAQEAQLTDRRGMRDLAWLLGHADSAVHVLELMAAQQCAAASPRARWEAGEDAQLRAGLDVHERQNDAQALRVYRHRLHELSAEMEEATEQGDLGRRERLSEEREQLVEQLTAGGRFRNRTVERARKAIYNRIREAIAHVERAHPTLGRHLSVSVRTGVYCCYGPEQAQRWQT